MLGARGPKNRVDPNLPYAWLVEPEPTASGNVEDVATVFLTNRECPYRCLFCDLWKNTTDERVVAGAIPRQIDYALARLPPARHIKLYNSGNFFDRQAIPYEDYSDIAHRVARFHTVIVENHPALCGAGCLEFRDLLKAGAKRQIPEREERGMPYSSDVRGEQAPQLEIAMGLETVHPDVLPRLNKRMTLNDFTRAGEFLSQNDIAARAFVLLKPPFMVEDECVDWALRSVEFAFDCGVRICCVIPTRSGNGILDRLAAEGDFAPPRLASLEAMLERGIALARGRVLVDLWDIERLFQCPHCGLRRAERLRHMNLSQRILPPIDCDCA
ncbi:MAG: radical SAM protein [Planctomycetia bacterium]|nr:radical SAM protein [Planctomycetia bacterium]